VRLAWFSPWPPQRSGVAGRSAELVPLLAARGHAIDVFVDAKRRRLDPVADAPPAAGGVRVLSAHDFIWRRRKYPYDLPVYQIGNSHLHRFIWAYLLKYPGLAVLHDGRVHHARAEALVPHARTPDYRAEFAWNHPDVPPAAAEFAALGLDGILYYQWPMLRGVVESNPKAHGSFFCHLGQHLTFPVHRREHVAPIVGNHELDNGGESAQPVADGAQQLHHRSPGFGS